MSLPVFLWIPDEGVKDEPQESVLSARYGDGYEDLRPDGVNTVSIKRSAQFSVRSDAELDLIEAFLTARGRTQAFRWQWPTTAPDRVWRCDRWSTTHTSGGRVISVDFRQVYVYG